MKRITFFLMVYLVGSLSLAYGQGTPKMRYEDKIRIREAINISKQMGEKIWNGINKVPFVILLVTDSLEFLVNHPYPSDDFKLSEDDKILKTKILYRKRLFPDFYLATFPAVNGVNCIVVGTPEKTNKNSSDWTITLLHEHFHQYQFTSPHYYDEVNALDLSEGDETGMWQLNYAFPFGNSNVIEQFKKYTSALLKVISTIEKKSFKKDFRNYLTQRERLKNTLSLSDYRYFSFQIWQEGIARYTEYKFIKALDNYTPTPEMAQIEDFIPFNNLKDKFYLSELNSIATSKLEKDKRVSFYAVGFAEGILLDKQNPMWQEKYLTDKFYIENYFNNE